MNAFDAAGRLVARKDMLDHRETVCDYVRRTCEAVCESIESFVPDSVLVESPGEIVIRIPLDGAATIEVRTESFVLSGKKE